MGVELIYEYMHQRSLVTRSEFTARFDGPVLLFRRIRTAEELADRTRTDVDGTLVKRVYDALQARQLQIRREAHDFRLVRLPANGDLAVGRTIDNDVTLPHRQVSKRHACIKCKNGEVFVTDLRSKNGTFINEQKIGDTLQAIALGQELRVGGVCLRLLSADELYDALDEMTEQVTRPPL